MTVNRAPPWLMLYCTYKYTHRPGKISPPAPKQGLGGNSSKINGLMGDGAQYSRSGHLDVPIGTVAERVGLCSSLDKAGGCNIASHGSVP